jgi:hypothetical protein
MGGSTDIDASGIEMKMLEMGGQAWLPALERGARWTTGHALLLVRFSSDAAGARVA